MSIRNARESRSLQPRRGDEEGSHRSGNGARVEGGAKGQGGPQTGAVRARGAQESHLD